MPIHIMSLCDWLHVVNATFHYPREEDPAFWLDMAERQIAEAREHLATGNRIKVLAEIADLIPVAFTALEKLGQDPETFTIARIRTRILPRAEEVMLKYGGESK